MTHPEDENTNKKSTADLGGELRELGQQLEHLMRGTFDNDRAKTIQKDVSSGMREIGSQMQNAIKAIQSDQRVRELAERGQRAVNQAQDSKVVQDFEDSLARGIAQLNDQLAGFVQRTRNDSAKSTTDVNAGGASTTTTSGAQRIPIESDEPATGKTVRLDPDEPEEAK